MPKIERPERQPYPSSEAVAGTKRWAEEDPRLGCWFCGDPSVALAPRQSGGDEDVPAHWLPVCQDHVASWHDETDAAERLPIIPRFGVMLTNEQALAIYAAVRDDSGANRASLNYEVDGMDEALDSLAIGLRAMGHAIEPPYTEPDDLTDERYHP
jgi:hypothetical protein